MKVLTGKLIEVVPGSHYVSAMHSKSIAEEEQPNPAHATTQSPFSRPQLGVLTQLKMDPRTAECASTGKRPMNRYFSKTLSIWPTFF